MCKSHLREFKVDIRLVRIEDWIAHLECDSISLMREQPYTKISNHTQTSGTVLHWQHHYTTFCFQPMIDMHAIHMQDKLSQTTYNCSWDGSTNSTRGRIWIERQVFTIFPEKEPTLAFKTIFEEFSKLWWTSRNIPSFKVRLCALSST